MLLLLDQGEKLRAYLRRKLPGIDPVHDICLKSLQHCLLGWLLCREMLTVRTPPHQPHDAPARECHRNDHAEYQNEKTSRYIFHSTLPCLRHVPTQ
jgi:hypothetical protein